MSDKRDAIQKEAVKAFLTKVGKGFGGTLQISTGVGKSFCFFKILYKLYNKNPNKKKLKVLLLAEVLDRKNDMIENGNVFERIYKMNPYKDFNIEFCTYQSACKWKNKTYDFVCADEIHDSFSPKRHLFYKNNEYDYLLGLTATPNLDILYEIPSGNPEIPLLEIQKRDFYKEYAPIIFKYNMQSSVENETSRKPRIYMISNSLDKINKNVKAGKAPNYFYQTEFENYNYFDGLMKKAWYMPSGSERERMMSFAMRNRSNLLYTLKSKEKTCKELLAYFKSINEKTILFGQRIKTLSEITPNVVSSKQPEYKNEALRSDLDEGKIFAIASAQKLQQGTNVVGLDNIILHSYYSTTGKFEQRLGRVRLGEKDYTNIIIIVTRGTQEDVWFTKMTSEMDVEITHCDNAKDCIDKIKGRA